MVDPEGEKKLEEVLARKAAEEAEDLKKLETMAYRGFAHVLLMVVNAALRGFALKFLWVWYAVDLFGAKPLSWAAAMGLGFSVSYAVAGVPSPSKAEDSFGKRLVFALVGNSIALLFGYLLHLWA